MWRPVGRLVVVVLWELWRPVRAFHWVIAELTGQNRRDRESQERREAMAARSPQGDAAFLAALSADPDDAPVALAVRRAVAGCCYLPAEALHPDDSRAAIELLFRAPLGAHWAELGGSWFEVLAAVEDDVGVRLPEDRIDRNWAAADRAGLLDSLRQVIAFFVGAIESSAARGAATGVANDRPSPRSRQNLPSGTVSRYNEVVTSKL